MESRQSRFLQEGREAREDEETDDGRKLEVKGEEARSEVRGRESKAYSPESGTADAPARRARRGGFARGLRLSNDALTHRPLSPSLHRGRPDQPPLVGRPESPNALGHGQGPSLRQQHQSGVVTLLLPRLR